MREILHDAACAGLPSWKPAKTLSSIPEYERSRYAMRRRVCNATLCNATLCNAAMSIALATQRRAQWRIESERSRSATRRQRKRGMTCYEVGVSTMPDMGEHLPGPEEDRCATPCKRPPRQPQPARDQYHSLSREEDGSTSKHVGAGKDSPVLSAGAEWLTPSTQSPISMEEQNTSRDMSPSPGDLPQ